MVSADAVPTEPPAVERQDLPPIPLPLPPGWVLKESRSQPDYYYYFHQDSGICSWEAPTVLQQQQQVLEQEAPEEESQKEEKRRTVTPEENRALEESVEKKRTAEAVAAEEEEDEAAPKPKRRKKSSRPSQVRILHILKKHKDSTRPSSWRKREITITKEEAMEELSGLIDILREEASSPDALRATFEELARTESDCSSAKRGGDLGFFGPKKMKPAFEEAAFALEIGEMSDMVETSSGVHVLLRIG
jgi:NIMA-interacting peptidyl-prolyl cis-trans isomerase 1